MAPLFCAIFAVVVVAIGPVYANGMAEGARAYDGGDYGEAVRQWTSAAANGHVGAAAALAGLYETGEGVDRDLARAKHWYRFAARRGDGFAQQQLGHLLSRDATDADSLVRAVTWLSLAARQGLDWAAKRRDVLLEHMTPAQQRQVAAGVHAFKPVREN